MIIRIWRTRFNTSQKEKLVTYANEVSLPVLSTREGVKGVLFGAKDNEWITITIWDTQDAIERLDDDPDYLRIVAGILDLGVLEEMQSVEVFDYQGGTLIDALSRIF